LTLRSEEPTYVGSTACDKATSRPTCRRTRLLYRSQRDAFVAELTRRADDDVIVDVPDQGMHLIAYRRHRRSDRAIEASARQRRIEVRAIQRMHKKAHPRRAHVWIRRLHVRGDRPCGDALDRRSSATRGEPPGCGRRVEAAEKAIHRSRIWRQAF